MWRLRVPPDSSQVLMIVEEFFNMPTLREMDDQVLELIPIGRAPKSLVLVTGRLFAHALDQLVEGRPSGLRWQGDLGNG